MKHIAHGCVIFALTLLLSACSRHRFPPNRGTQLFLVIHERGRFFATIPISESERYVVQQWHPDKGTYDFILSAITARSAEGCKVHFTRYVMTEDYNPRSEQLDLDFPYTQQANYRFFDYGSTVGVYRNSIDDTADFSPAHT
jgi:hypothetical protein